MIIRNLKGLLLFFFLCNAALSNAQREGRKKNTGIPTVTPAAQTTDTSRPQQPAFDYSNYPIEKVPESGGLSESPKPSKHMDGPFAKQLTERVPLIYEHVRADDALFHERVWREIDTREKINQVFRYKAEDDNGDQRFISILVRTIRSSLSKGKMIAFSGDDDRFTTPLDSAAFERILNGGSQCDTLPVYKLNPLDQIEKFIIVCNTLNPDDIVKFRIKEDWVFDRESSRMLVRITGIAPLKTIFSIDKKTERGVTPLFWVYYPEIRPILAKYEIYNSKNLGQSRTTWEELFESRMFGSYIVKSTLDNTSNKFIRNYINDPILRLLEGDNIKEKIFNYEQDLWSY